MMDIFLKAVRYSLIAGLFIMVMGGSSSQGSGTGVPVNGMVTMVDLGATKCIPCKMMAPIMEKLEKSYQGKAAIIFIDVWENKGQAKKFKISSIPTQIFFDAHGREVYRHVGFLGEDEIVAQLSKMGVSR